MTYNDFQSIFPCANKPRFPMGGLVNEVSSTLEIGAVRALPAGLRSPAVVRGGHLHIYAGRCRCGPMILIAGRVRAPRCQLLRASAGMYSIYAVQCGPMFYIAFNFVIEKMFPFIKEMICCIARKCVFV